MSPERLAEIDRAAWQAVQSFYQYIETTLALGRLLCLEMAKQALRDIKNGKDPVHVALTVFAHMHALELMDDLAEAKCPLQYIGDDPDDNPSEGESEAAVRGGDDSGS